MNRRLIRPSLSEIKDQMSNPTAAAGPGQRRKPVPPEQTHAESYYYVKQMQARTPVVVVLTDGEALRGTIEWYDKSCIKLTRSDAPNLLIYKACIKYIHKDEAAGGSNGSHNEEPEMAHSSHEDD